MEFYHERHPGSGPGQAPNTKFSSFEAASFSSFTEFGGKLAFSAPKPRIEPRKTRKARKMKKRVCGNIGM
jgi:hypothetical protein